LERERGARVFWRTLDFLVIFRGLETSFGSLEAPRKFRNLQKNLEKFQEAPKNPKKILGPPNHPPQKLLFLVIILIFHISIKDSSSVFHKSKRQRLYMLHAP
jgi:hypothetical protein